MEISAVVAIDFTESNGKVSKPGSLHSEDLESNQYLTAIKVNLSLGISHWLCEITFLLLPWMPSLHVTLMDFFPIISHRKLYRSGTFYVSWARSKWDVCCGIPIGIWTSYLINRKDNRNSSSKKWSNASKLVLCAKTASKRILTFPHCQFNGMLQSTLLQ